MSEDKSLLNKHRSVNDNKKGEAMMTVKELRVKTGLSQSRFADRFGIPIRSVQHWEQGRQDPPSYVVSMIERILELEELCKQLNERLSKED